MKILRITLLSVIAFSLIFSFAFAVNHTPQERGKALFNDSKLAGAISGKSCNSCHPDGKGLEKAAEKKEFKVMAGKQHSLEEVVNVCIENAIRGKKIDPKSDQMKDMVAYIKSLGMKMEKKEMPMKKAPGY